MTWRDRVDELLFAGESVRERVAVDDHELVVTSHRVLWFAPEGADGPQFRHVDRPNVADVRIETRESLRRLGWALIFGVLGAALIYVASSFEFASAVPSLNGGGPGTGAVDGTVEALESMLAAFEQLLLALGALSSLAALGTFAWYLRYREQRLVVAVVGDEDLSIPRPANPREAVRVLEAAIEGEATDERRPIAPTAGRAPGPAERGAGSSRGGPVGVGLDGADPDATAADPDVGERVDDD